METCIAAGCAPDLDLSFVLTPVDFIARAIVGLSLQPRLQGKAFHLMNPQEVSLRQLVEWVRALGHPLEVVPFAEWLARARTRASAAALPHLPAPRQQRPPAAAAAVDDGVNPDAPTPAAETDPASPALASDPSFDSRNAVDGLAATGIVCPPIDPESLQAFLARSAGAVGAAADGGSPR